MYQARAGGTTNDAITAPMIAPANAKINIVFTIEVDRSYLTGAKISSQLLKMAEHEPDNSRRANETNTISLDGRRLSEADLYAVAARPDVTRVRIFALKQNLGPLATLTSLRHLELTDPYLLDGLERLQQIESLMLYAFPRISSLNVVGALTNLKKLMLSTPPGYDASRKCYEVESFEPLGQLANLEALTMRGIVPRTGGLEPIRRLTGLRRVDITHVYVFGVEDYARLAAALPLAEGHSLQPVFEAAWAGTCPRCGSAKIALTAPPPHTPKTACPICDRERIERHLTAWNRVLSQATP